MEFGLGQCRGGRQLLEIVMILFALPEIAENLGPEHQHYQDAYHWGWMPLPGRRRQGHHEVREQEYHHVRL